MDVRHLPRSPLAYIRNTDAHPWLRTSPPRVAPSSVSLQGVKLTLLSSHRCLTHLHVSLFHSDGDIYIYIYTRRQLDLEIPKWRRIQRARAHLSCQLSSEWSEIYLSFVHARRHVHREPMHLAPCRRIPNSVAAVSAALIQIHCRVRELEYVKPGNDDEITSEACLKRFWNLRKTRDTAIMGCVVEYVKI